MRTVESALQTYQLDQRAYPLAVGEFSISYQVPNTVDRQLFDTFKINEVSTRLLQPNHSFILFFSLFVVILLWILRRNGPFGDLENRKVRLHRIILIGLSALIVPITISAIFLLPCYCPEVIETIKNPDHSKSNFGYQNLGGGFILQSNGPDGDIDFKGIAIDQELELTEDALMETLKPLMYDTSNGSISNGDLFRVVGNGL